MVERISRELARRACVIGQLLTAQRPASLVETLYGLAVVNLDPTAAIAPSAEHIVWSRIGTAFQAGDLRRAEEVDRDVFEWGGFLRLMADLPLLRAEMRERPRSEAARQWLAANRRFRRDVLDRLRADGPLHAADVPDTAEVSWTSSGWTHSRNAVQMLEMLVAGGSVAIWGRDAKGRLFDVAERVYPDDLPEVTDAAAARERAERRLGSLGIAPAKAAAQQFEPIDVGDIGLEIEIDGSLRRWRADAAVLEAAASSSFTGRTALLSPFDRIVSDRPRLAEVFEYEYLLEMFKPAAKRRFGFFALPILHGDRFVGKLDAKADRRAGVLRVNTVHEDVPFDEALAVAVEAEIRALADWLGLEVAAST